MLEQRKRRGMSLCRESYGYCSREHVEMFVSIAWAGMPIEPTCSSACAGWTSWLLDFFDYLPAFFIRRRAESARCPRAREKEGRNRARRRNERLSPLRCAGNRILRDRMTSGFRSIAANDLPQRRTSGVSMRARRAASIKIRVHEIKPQAYKLIPCFREADAACTN